MLTVDDVENWQLGTLGDISAAAEGTASGIHNAVSDMMKHTNALMDTWKGEAARAAENRVLHERALGAALAEATDDLSHTANSARNALAGEQDNLRAKVTAARAKHYQVAPDGGVTAPDQLADIKRTSSGPPALAAALRIMTECAWMEVQIRQALTSCDTSAREWSGKLKTVRDAVHTAHDNIMSGKMPTNAPIGPGLTPTDQFGKDAPSQPDKPAPVDKLPGQPMPVDPNKASMGSPMTTTRIFPGQTLPAGFNDPNTPAPPGPWNQTVHIDPDKTPGATAPYSGNILSPNPMDQLPGSQGDSPKVGVPAWDQGKLSPDGKTTRKPTHLDIDLSKGVQLRIVGAKPTGASEANIDGKPTLVVSYQYQYQVQNVWSAGNNAFQHSTAWQDISPDDVQALADKGAILPEPK